LIEEDKNNTIARYNERLAQFGFSEKTLGWSRGKSHVRFQALTSLWEQELNQAKIADFGCGFGDLFGFLKNTAGILNFEYTGIDINEKLIEMGQIQYPEANYWIGDILNETPPRQFDFIFSSGVFNHKFSSGGEYEFIEKCVNRLYQLCNRGIAIDFLSDKVEYQLEHTFHSSPSKILEICYGITNNVVLRNDFMPYEFTVYLRKDKHIDPEKIIYI
jgi:2-polyprenyl-3-methyl-5-hydroxy-6-metoxy-1,4-benzoquinol methylase